MIQGTASAVGKSLIATGLCRIFKQDGFKVAPFKSQNIALNSFVTRDGKEMGRAQAVQAEAAGIEPSVAMNPILIKPASLQKTQVIVNGAVLDNLTVTAYHDLKPQLLKLIQDTYHALAKEYDIIVIEGAGSPVEINLKDRDLVNMGMAELADAPVILVGDIDKGGVFAALAGTMLLFAETERARVKGVIINKFRGDLALLKPGLEMLESIIKVPVLGVVPYTRLNLEDEDSVSERLNQNSSSPGEIEITIIKLPYISNFTDFNALEEIPGVKIRYVDAPDSLGSPDLIVIPGSKNTIDDLFFLRNSGLENAINRRLEKGVPIFGICGGFQMLGLEIIDPQRAESELGRISGMGLLKATTIYQPRKQTTQVEGIITGAPGLLEGLHGLTVSGYEIHLGKTDYQTGCFPYLTITQTREQADQRVDGLCNETGSVIGTYLHGIFDNYPFTVGVVNNLRKKKGLPPLETANFNYAKFKETQYDQLADLLRNSLDLEKIYGIMNG
jgi:adenosylcobyric acid synthase